MIKKKKKKSKQERGLTAGAGETFERDDFGNSGLIKRKRLC